MYSFRERSDTLVVDEPLYGHYLTVSGAEHPGEKEVVEVMECDPGRVVEETILGPCERPVHFFKNMAHHLVGMDRGFLARVTNVLLIRDPEEMLPSLVNQIPRPVLRDTGLQQQVEILDAALQSNTEPMVLDAKDLLTDPKGVLRLVCERLGIPFEEEMMRWPAGPKPEDGIWARHWYAGVHASTGFQAYRAKTEPFPEKLIPLLEECAARYERLRRYAVS